MRRTERRFYGFTAAIDDLRRLFSFFGAELHSYPGRANVMLRCVLASAIVIVISMTLQVPLLALSLIVVFYVTQANVVLTRMLGVLFAVGSTAAVAGALFVLKMTFDYPLLRILLAGGIFLFSVFMMRVTKIGIVFFLVALVVIYVQTFVDETDQAEILVRTVLWVWVAVNYAIVLTLVINALLLPLEPSRQLEAAMCSQLKTLDVALACLEQGNPVVPRPKATEVEAGMLTLQKLLRFCSMREKNDLITEASQFACVTAVSRLYAAIRNLPEAIESEHVHYVAALRQACLELMSAIRTESEFQVTDRLRDLSDLAVPGALIEMRRALESFSDRGRGPAAGLPKQPKNAFFVDDAWTNPVYKQFALKTLLGVLLGYVFYLATDWQGIHTIMLTCLIVAQPSLGATGRRSVLRMGGAMLGSLLALASVVWVVPRIDGIVGLLFMTLPVIALGAWTAAGSERISYAGVQIMFTFALALLEQFAPSTNLTEIRDRMVGIFLGVVLSTWIQGGLWPESEGEFLRQKLARLLQHVIRQIRPNALVGPTPVASWVELDDCVSMSARIALEPEWNVGEGQQEQFNLRVQTVLAQVREIFFAFDAFDAERNSIAMSIQARDHVDAIRHALGTSLDTYASGLTVRSYAIPTPSTARASALADALSSYLQQSASEQSVAAYQRFVSRTQDLIAQVSSLPAWEAHSITDLSNFQTLHA